MSDDDISVDSSDAEEVAEHDSKLNECLQWTSDQVGDWVESIGFSIYRDCFVSNCITGRRLILIEASSLPKLGIYDFDHIKMITQNIRELLNIELMPWNRSISLPPREVLAMFLERKCTTGERGDVLTYSKFTEQWEDLKFQPPLSNYCSMLPKD